MRRWILTAVSMSCLAGGTIAAAAPFGPPRATVGAGKWAIGIDYARQKTELKSFGLYREGYVADQWYCKNTKFEIKDLESNIILGKIEYGLRDSWDIFARVGVSDATGDLVVPSVSSDGPPATSFFDGGERLAIDSGFALAWGAGSKMTFAETGDIAWGTVVQMTWFKPAQSESSWTDPTDAEMGINATIDLQYWEIQLAAGPTVNLGALWLYGGPFMYFAKGDLDVGGTWTDTGDQGPIQADHDLRDNSNFGGFAGLQWNLAENACFYVEGQFTGDGWAAGGGGAWRLN